MKKWLIVLGGVLVLSGCAETSELALKEKCYNYLKSFEQKITEKCVQLPTGFVSCSAGFVAYSAERNSCIGKEEETIYFNDTSQKPLNTITYHDLMTGESIRVFSARQNTEEYLNRMTEISQYESVLKLIK